MQQVIPRLVLYKRLVCLSITLHHKPVAIAIVLNYLSGQFETVRRAGVQEYDRSMAGA